MQTHFWDWSLKDKGITVTSEKIRARSETPFRWSVFCTMYAYAELAGVRFDLLFRDADAIAEAYHKGKPLAEDLFGPDVEYGGPGWAGISYGHINTLGSELIFPVNSEVTHTPIYSSLEEGIRALKEREDLDFSTQGMFPIYLDLWEKLKKAFPNESIPFTGFKAEGPITTAWCLRGSDFFIDILTEPEQATEYLYLVTQSIIKYDKLLRTLNARSEFVEDGVVLFGDIEDGVILCDDIAAMISPASWPEIVLPFLKMYYAEQTSGTRSAHIEGLSADHLKYLDDLKLDSYDPSLSPKLTPALIRDRCNVPFAWRLNTIHYPELSEGEVERWVFEAAADGASRIFTHGTRAMCTQETARKLRAFIRAGKAVKALLDEGCSRELLHERATRVEQAESLLG